jgi:hypothetical protein
MTLHLTPRLRLALAAKGILLLVLGAVFATLIFGALTGDHHVVTRALALLVSVPIAAFLASNALKAFADAVLGQVREVHGAEALGSNRSGLSFRLPDGRFAEFVLFNPWQPLVAGRRYTVVIGRWSRVVLAPPILE